MRQKRGVWDILIMHILWKIKNLGQEIPFYGLRLSWKIQVWGHISSRYVIQKLVNWPPIWVWSFFSILMSCAFIWCSTCQYKYQFWNIKVWGKLRSRFFDSTLTFLSNSTVYPSDIPITTSFFRPLLTCKAFKSIYVNVYCGLQYQFLKGPERAEVTIPCGYEV